MPARIIVKDAANLAIIEQWEYYDAKQGMELANRWDLAAGAAIESLRESPERGLRCHFANPVLSLIRWIPVKGFPYRIFYLLNRAANAVVIIQIFHERRDIADLLESALRNM